MIDIKTLEEYYKKYISDLSHWIPEGLYMVNLDLLNRFNLLSFKHPEKTDTPLTDSFHIIETPDKLTMVNDEFIIWILPADYEGNPATYTLIALNQNEVPKLELAFIASGVYNTSKLVLRILEKFLLDIQEAENILGKYKKG